MFALLACALGFSSLAIDESRIAVFAPLQDPARLAASLGTDATLVTPWPIAGWWLVCPSAPETASELIGRIACVESQPFFSPVFVGADGGAVFTTADLLVRFVHGTDPGRQATLLAALSQFQIVEWQFGGMADTFRLRTSTPDGRDVIAAARGLALEPEVLFAEPDLIFTGQGSQSVPNDPLFPVAWGLHNTGQSGGTPDVDVDAPEAWMRTQGSATVIIAILDVGVESTHPDLVLSFLPGADVTSDGPGTGDPVNVFDNHGTPIAGCLVAHSNNAQGACGMAPGCRAVSVRTFIAFAPDGSWTSQTSWTVDALTIAQLLGARITNNSNQYGIMSAAINQKYLDLWNAGVVNFGSAGNAGASSIDYPANLPGVNAVGSVNRMGGLSASSNTGPELDFVAPGDSIITTDRSGPLGWDPNGDYTFAQGTSFATPFAAGIAALLLSIDPTLTAPGVEQLMRDSSRDLGVPGPDPVFGNGLVNALDALVLACGAPETYCIAAPNSAGPGAFIGWTGSQSVSANNLVLTVSGVPPLAAGLFFFGVNPVQVPFGNGFRCVGGGVTRLPPIVLSSPLGDTIYPLDLANLPQGQVFPAGSVRLFQLWYRNPTAGGAGFNLSDGLRVRFCP